jgi:hypothetical protein
MRLTALGNCCFVGMLCIATSTLTATPPPDPCGPTQINNHTGNSTNPCACFLVNEQAGAVFQAPAQDYPIEILKIGIGWGSLFNTNPASLELAVHLYPAGLPAPGVAQFTLAAPVLNDAVINVFDISQALGNKSLGGGPFTVALEFLNQNANSQTASSVVDDANGCTAGQNAIFTIPGGWSDACQAGVQGDWVMFVEYRCMGTVSVDEKDWGSVKVLYSSDARSDGATNTP